MNTVIEADLTWIEGAFQRGVAIAIESDGTIESVGNVSAPPTQRLKHRAILPGFVNAHSHAFQRALRGSGENFPEGAGSFWTWRDAMYRLVQEMDEARLRAVSEQAFREMLGCGITTVGEFHYLHHATDEADFAFDRTVLEAADAAGIRIVLLNTYYETGGINQPLTAAQRRFRTTSIEGFWENFDSLAAPLRGSRLTLGVAAHSIRAVPLHNLVALSRGAAERDLPFHMHIEEQPLEIEASRQEFGTTPLGLLRREIEISPAFTAVHCTHSGPEDLEQLHARGGRICVCPLTEANLGDGIPPAEIHKTGARLCLGTDSNARISMFEEMRWLEYGQRLEHQRRGVLLDQRGDSAARLIEIATSGGASALGLNTGEIKPGRYADFVSIDLTHPSLSHTDPAGLSAALVFGCNEAVIDAVCVGGVWRDATDLAIRPASLT